MGTQYKSLLGLTEVIADSAEISNIDLEATNITGLTTSRIPEGYNLYYTDARVSENPNVSSNTTHRERKDNPHGVTAAQVGIHTTNDIIEGHINLYYTDIRFDDRLATKTTTSLAEGSNLYYTTTRANSDFDTRFGIKTTDDLTEASNLYYTTTRANADFDARLATKTTTNLTEGTNLYYTDARFDTRLATKTTTNLTEGTNLYYTDARFDARFGIKTTTNLTEGTNLYYTDARFDARFGTKTTDDLTEGKNNIYYTEARVSANADVKANTAYRNTGHLPLAGGTLTGDLNMGNQNIINSNALTIGASARKINITGGIEITGVGNTADGSHVTYFTTTDNYPIFQNLNYTHNAAYLTFDGYYDFKAWKKSHSTATFQISKEYDQLNFNVWNTGAAGSTINGIQSSHAMIIDANKCVKIYNGLDVTGNITISGTVDGVDLKALNTTVNNHIENTNNPHDVLATQIADFDTEVSANVDVKANTAYRNTGHLPLTGGTLTGEITWDTDIEIPTWVSDTVYTPSDDANWSISSSSIYDSNYRKYEAFNKTVDGNGTNCWISAAGRYNTNGTVNASTYTTAHVDGSNSYQGEWIQVRHTEKKLRLTSFILTARSKYTEYSKSYRLLGTNDDPTTVTANWTTLMTSSLSWGSPGASLVLTPETRLGYYNTYRLLITQCTVAYCSIARFIPAFVTEGNTISNVFSINGTPIDTLIADVKANTAYTAIGHLPLAGGTLTGDLNLGGNNLIDIGIIKNGVDITVDDTVAFPVWTSNTSANSDGWFISSSSVLQNNARYDTFKAVDNSANTSWIAGGFNQSTGVGSAWYKFNYTPEPLLLTSITIRNRISSYRGPPRDFTIEGSNDDTKWTVIYSTTENTGWASGESRVFELTGNDRYFNYHRIFITRIQPSVSSGVDYVSVDFPNLTLFASRKALEVNEDGVFSYRNLDITGDLSISGELNIGGEKIARGATNGLQLYGPSSDIGGPHIQAFVSTDDYPVFQQLNNSHGSIAMCFDAYADGFTWKSSSSESNAIIYKSNTDLEFSYSSGVVAGGVVTWNAGFSMDLANGLVTCYNGLDVTGDLIVSGTVDGVDLKALETDVKANTAKVSYTDATKVGLISVTQAVNLDTMESNIATNNNKVSASGSINTHSDVNLNLLKDYEVLTYFSGEWKNMTTQAPDTSAFLVINGTKAMTGNLNMGNQDIDNVNQIFVDRKSTSNNKIVLYDGGTPSTTAFYGFGIQSATLLYNVDSSAANHKFYYGGTNELFRIGNAAVYSYRDLDVKGNITVSGTVDGVDVAAVKSAVDTNTAKVSASGSINTHSDVNITTPADGHVLTYTGSEWKNIPPAAADGYLPLDGGTMTGPLKLEVSRPTGGWASYLRYTGGTVNGSTYGFLLDANSFYLTAHNDDYSYSHPIMRFDHDGYCYAMKNFSAGTYKVVDVGAPTGPLDAANKMYVDNAVGGRLSLNGGTMRGNIDMGGYNINTVGTVDGYNLDTLNTNINSKLPLSGGTVSGNLTTNGLFTANGGSKITVQNTRNGTRDRGIFMWSGNDPNWGIYMAQSGDGRSLNNQRAPAWNFNSYAIRFRVANASDTGFIWERNDENAIASLNCNGVFQSRGPYSNLSDRRQKENFGETFGLDFINKLKPLSFSMTFDEEKQIRHGLIAQDVEEVLAGYDTKFSGLRVVKVKIPNPECKYKDDPEKCTMLDTGEVEYSLAYSEFIAPLIEAVQELSAEMKEIIKSLIMETLQTL